MFHQWGRRGTRDTFRCSVLIVTLLVGLEPCCLCASAKSVSNGQLRFYLQLQPASSSFSAENSIESVPQRWMKDVYQCCKSKSNGIQNQQHLTAPVFRNELLPLHFRTFSLVPRVVHASITNNRPGFSRVPHGRRCGIPGFSSPSRALRFTNISSGLCKGHYCRSQYWVAV